jgi:transcriptional regulator with XRE-family HTH domain
VAVPAAGPVALRGHRLRLNLTLEEVAEALTALAWERFAVRVGVNAGVVGKWERGEKRPSRFYQRLFVLLYGAPAEQLGFRPAGPTEQAAEDVLMELGAREETPRALLPNSAAPGGPGPHCLPYPHLSALTPKRSGGWGRSSPSTPRSTTCWGRLTCWRSRHCI